MDFFQSAFIIAVEVGGMGSVQKARSLLCALDQNKSIKGRAMIKERMKV